MLNGGGINPDGLSLDLQFAADKTFSKPSSLAAGETAITSRRGPSATFLRSTAATEVGPDGLIRYAPENLLTKSEEFNDAAWGKAAVSVTSNAITAPNGALTADAIIENTANTIHRVVSQSITSLAGVTYSYSVYAKNNGRRYLYMNFGALFTAAATFDLQDGTFISASGAASITNVGDGWYRCTVTGASVAGASGTGALQLNNSSAATDSTYLGDGVSGIFLWGAQLERHPTARTYIPTTTAVVYGPRFDHDPVTLACKGLLIEEGRTNLVTWSEEFNNTSGWSQGLGFATANQTTSPSGNNDADLLSARNSVYGGILRRAVAPAYAANTTYTMSVYAKAGTHQFIGLRLSSPSSGSSGDVYSVFTLSGSGSATAPTPISGTINSVSCVSAGGGWYRCTLVYTTGSTAPVNTTDIAICQSNGNTAFTPAGTETVYLWGAQLEVGSFATSYIPTTTGSVVRSADVCSVTTAGWSNAGNDTMVAEYFIRNLSNFLSGSVVLEGGPAISWMSVSFTGVNQQRNLYRHGGTINRVDAVSGTDSVSLTSINKTALTSGEQIALNGSLSQTLLGDPTQSDISTILNIGRRSDFGGANYLNGHIAAIRYYKKRLPNAKIQALTV